MNNCPVCGAELCGGLQPWHLVCTACGYEGSNLHINIISQPPGGALDETAREVALSTLRRSNFRRLLAMIARSTMPSSVERSRMLDVGSAHGWFIELAQKSHEVVGVEPDRTMTAATANKHLPVREGFFPDVLCAGELFDVIVFNDVLEHIPDISATLAACAEHLNENGLLVINAPNSGGAFYWMSKQLLRLGYHKSFGRLWQFGFPSPHLHYLDSNVVARIAKKHGYALIEDARLPSVSISGLYARVRYSRDVSIIKAVALVVAISIATPILAILPPDIKVWILRKR